MRRLLFILFAILMFGLNQIIAQTKIGDNSSKINPSAILELESTKKGFLMPRMNSTQMNSIAIPPVGLQVFNTDSSCVCLFTNKGWQSLCNNNAVNAWSLEGNNISSPNQYLGTKNKSNLRIKTNNQERMIVDSIGNVGISTSSPTSTFDLNGSFSTAFKEINNNYIATIKDHIIAGDAINSDIAITLPSAFGIKGRQYVFKKTDESNHIVMVKAQVGEKIDGDISLKISIPWQTKTIVSNGKKWLVISNQ